jgi:hypothetical protein
VAASPWGEDWWIFPELPRWKCIPRPEFAQKRLLGIQCMPKFESTGDVLKILTAAIVVSAFTYSIAYVSAIPPLPRLVQWPDLISLSYSGVRSALLFPIIVVINMTVCSIYSNKTGIEKFIVPALFVFSTMIFSYLFLHILLSQHELNNRIIANNHHNLIFDSIQLIAIIHFIFAVIIIIVSYRGTSIAIYASIGFVFTLCLAYTAGYMKAQDDLSKLPCSRVFVNTTDSSGKTITKPLVSHDQSIIMLNGRRVFWIEGTGADFFEPVSNQSIYIEGNFCHGIKRAHEVGRSSPFLPEIISDGNSK